MKSNSSSTKLTLQQVKQWSGPLPSPDALERYNAVIPGAAERILAMAEKEMEHRHKREDVLLKQEELLLERRWNIAMLSTVFGFICVLVLSVLIGYALYLGVDNVALGSTIGAIAVVAGLFTYGKIKQGQKEE